MKAKWTKVRLGPTHPCPVCGKQPKIYNKYENGGWFCRIQCKRIFGGTHAIIETYGRKWSDVWEVATQTWSDLPRDEG